MRKPVLHLICNAHLDPVWQWRWEEGAASAIGTFAIAARLLREFPEFIFNHNEAILYRWVQEHDPALFAEIRGFVREGRWCISGGWDLQPDVNMPGTEAIVRHIAEGRRYFREQFGAAPRVAYNFDSFGHSGGLPQLLARAGFSMYVHMRPEEKDLKLPSDLYCWEGVDGSRIAGYRIPFPAYNTFPGTAVERINAAAEIALHLNRDTPVFWGMGDHGGGGSRDELMAIRQLIARESRVEIIHSSTEKYYEAVKHLIPSAPIVRGDLQRVFTGCYTSMSRLKRRMERNLGELVQVESVRTAGWWLRGMTYPGERLEDAWRDHLFNDFHDILPGSSIEAAELDALDLYGRSSETLRRLRLGAVAGFGEGKALPLEVPLAVLNANPAGASLPVEFEYMIDHLPRLTGKWHAQLLTLDGSEIVAQEEASEQLLLVDQWRRRLCFEAPLPHVGAAHFRIDIREGEPRRGVATPASPHNIDASTSLVSELFTEKGRNVLAGPLFRPLVVEDDADSWGMERWNYRNVTGEFTLVPGTPRTVEAGPIRTVREAIYRFGASSILLRTLSYASHPFIECRFRVLWNEERHRLKLSVPTRLERMRIFCEVPGGGIHRPADGEEQTHGRWMIASGEQGGEEASLLIANSGQHGFDARDGEIRLSVLRSAPYCYERAFPLAGGPHRKVMDLGVHEFRLLVAAGREEELLQKACGWTDWLNAPPFALPHYPIGEGTPAREELLRIEGEGIRLLACKRSWEGEGLVIRVQEATGRTAVGRILLARPAVTIPLELHPFEIRTIRCGPGGEWSEVPMVEESS